MSLESSIHHLTAAIRALTEAIAGPAVAQDPIEPLWMVNDTVHASPPCDDDDAMVIINMDDAGVPSKFKLRCSICGELGRNSRTCQPTPDGSGSYHWKVTQE